MARSSLLDSWRRRPAVSHALWSHALDYCRYAQALPVLERRRLRETVNAFLRAKHIEGAAGFEPTPQMHAIVALKACVPILHLGLACYADWKEIVIYPGDFRVHDEYTDEIGIVHRETRDLCGQSLSQGPIVLSWQTLEEERELADRDVVIHECAHKLDILNGAADGFPPLPTGMSAPQWTRAFRDAYDRFSEAVGTETDARLDPYAATDPAEFFAVLSETFFTEPETVYLDFPKAYRQLSEFYRQDPYAILERVT